MPQKADLNGSTRDPQKRHFLTPEMSFSRFSNFDLCRGTLGSQPKHCKQALREGFLWDAAFVLTVGGFLHTVELFTYS